MCNDSLENVKNALVRNATTAWFPFTSTAESPLVKNVVMVTGNLPNVRNTFCHRTDNLHRKALPNVAFVDFTCIFEIRNAEKLILFLKSQWCTNILRQSSCHIASIALQSRDYQLQLASNSNCDSLFAYCADHPVLCSVRNTFAKNKQQHKINIVTKLMEQTIRNKNEQTYHFKRCQNRHLWSFLVDFFHSLPSVKQNRFNS